MTIIKIQPHENGAHDNQTMPSETPATFLVPEGYAVIPEEVGTPDTLENYPFGEITVEDRDGLPTVTSWRPLPMPEPEPELPRDPTADELLAALLGDTLASESGGGVTLESLAALGPERYNNLSGALHRLGLCPEVEV